MAIMDFYDLISTVGILALTLILCTAGYYIIFLAYLHAKYDHLPGPKRTSFFLGNAPEIFRSTRHPRDCLELSEGHAKVKPLAFQKWTEWSYEYGDLYLLFILHRPLIIIKGQSMLKTVLVDSDPQLFLKSEFFDARTLFGQRLLGDGLVTAIDHDGWYLRRKVVDPFFHRKQLKLAIESFNFSGDKFIAGLQHHVESGEYFKLSPLLHHTTLDVIMKVMFSIDTNDLHTEFHNQAIDFVTKSFEAIQKKQIPLMEYSPYYYKYREEIRGLMKSFRQIGEDIILKRQAALLNKEDVSDDLLSALVTSETYDFQTIVDDFVTMILAGMETSANCMAFIFMELGRRPDLLQRLLAEVDEVVGQRPFITYDDITKLSFTSLLIKESLRKYSVVPGALRCNTRETELDGWKIPANSNIILNIPGANNDGRYVENPDKFDPDRFDPKAAKRVPSYSFLSFSLGARNCVGQTFAQMEMKLLLAKFFQHYSMELHPSESFLIGQQLTCKPMNELNCRVSVRTLTDS